MRAFAMLMVLLLLSACSQNEVKRDAGGSGESRPVSNAAPVNEEAGGTKDRNESFSVSPGSESFTGVEDAKNTETTKGAGRVHSYSVSWTDEGVVLEDAFVPFVIVTDKGYRMYYCGMGGIESAFSRDGISFEREDGARITPGRPDSDEKIVCDATLVRFGGEYRMYYKGADRDGGPGQATHKIFTASSEDGVVFEKEGVVIDASDDGGWASVPEAVIAGEGVRIYYVSGASVPEGVASAFSKDGLHFKREPGFRAPGLVDPAVAVLDDGKFMMLAVQLAGPGPAPLQPGIYALFSDDGMKFSGPVQVFLSERAVDPAVVKIGDNTFRVYYGDAEIFAIRSGILRVSLE